MREARRLQLAAAMPGFAPNERIGNYRIVRELGATRTGVLYEVVHLVLPRRAIVKVMSPTVAKIRAFAVQLMREACILEALHHPGAPQLYESGLLPDRRPWFAVESVDGITLAERIAIGRLSARDTTLVIRDLADVLAYVHRRGVIHRGLRIDRVVLTPQRAFATCIPDWSEACTHDTAAPIQHVTGRAARYLAPELVRGDAVDDRVDIFALGVIAHLALTGEHPVPGRATLDARPSAPRDLAARIDQMLAPDRFDRPSAEEVRADLDWLADALEASELAALAQPRIRKPRWTPMGVKTCTMPGIVSGEIDAELADELDGDDVVLLD